MLYAFALITTLDHVKGVRDIINFSVNMKTVTTDVFIITILSGVLSRLHNCSHKYPRNCGSTPEEVVSCASDMGSNDAKPLGWLSV